VGITDGQLVSQAANHRGHGSGRVLGENVDETMLLHAMALRERLGHCPRSRVALRGAVEAARSLGEDTLQRCHRVLGPDHVITLLTAAALTAALAPLGEVEPARTLGEDTLQRCHRLLGPDQVITLVTAAALTSARAATGLAEAARALGGDTLQRSHRVSGPHHPVTRYAAQVAGDSSP
jgi:hypothetical protein